ncbi:MAG TPA: DUF1353 domain-containing protein [Mycobacterium sp.]|nr:DUF1353 domain-containing protein [Mycobacterium sp.]
MARELGAPEQVLHVRQSYHDPRSEHDWDQWTTTRPLFVQADVMLRVDADFDSDLVSVPNMFAWFIPRAGRYARAAVLHDYLWKRVAQEGYDRRVADRQFRFAMQAAEVSLLRRWIMWATVRMNSILAKHDPGKGGLMDLPGALLVLTVAFPIVAPPAVLILVSSAVFTVTEKVTWALSKLWPGPSEPSPKAQFKT